MKTVLILGAGSSAGLNYPCGAELSDRICRKLEPPQYANQPYREKLLQVGFHENQIDEFQQRLHQGNLGTIDAFLEFNAEFASLGKLAITLDLSSYEDERAFVSNSLLIKDWYAPFWAGLLKNFDLISRGQLSFITFNYDRSLEHFQYMVCKAGRPDLLDEFTDWLNSDRCLHIHGRMGYLDWQNRPDAETRSYGNECTAEEIQRSAELILLPHECEGVDAKVESIMRDAERVLFLGFGFDDRNLRKLGIGHLHELRHKDVAATKRDLSLERMAEIRRICRRDLMPDTISDCLRQSGFPNW